MKANLKKLILPAIVTLIPLLVGLVLYNRLPDPVATHFGFSGEPNGWTSRAFTVFGIPLFLLVLLIIGYTYSVNRVPQQNARALGYIIWIIPGCSMLLTIQVYGYALQMKMDMTRIATIIFGLLFLGIGNSLPKIRQNPVLGIRTPWTLKDDVTWERTHRATAPVWVICGALSFFLGAIGFLHPAVLIILLVLMAAFPVVYSFVIRKR